MSNHYEKLHSSQQIQIWSPSVKYIDVFAHLPEQFGFGFGNDIGSPFASYISEGTFAKVVAWQTGATARSGLFTKKIFMGPEQSDISLDLAFETYEDSYEDVVVPIINIIALGAYLSGSGMTFYEKVKNNTVFGLIADGVSAATSIPSEQMLKQINFAAAPPLLNIRYGNLMVMENMYVSNANITFSNVLDVKGFPMEAKVSLSLTPSEPFNKGSLHKSLDHSTQYNRNY